MLWGGRGAAGMPGRQQVCHTLQRCEGKPLARWHLVKGHQNLPGASPQHWQTVPGWLGSVLFTICSLGLMSSSRVHNWRVIKQQLNKTGLPAALEQRGLIHCLPCNNIYCGRE